MCLLGLAIGQSKAYPLVVVANRDEFYARPTAPMAWWGGEPDILAGRDLRAGGTWMGLTRGGRLAALTNYRDPSRERVGARSRGELVTGFLLSEASPADYLATLRGERSESNGYNLVFGHFDELYVYSNIDDRARRLTAGIYGVSNHLLDTPWPKVERLKSGLATCLSRGAPDVDELFALLDDRARAADEGLPETGVGLLAERALSSVFVHIPETGYGTRSSTVMLVSEGSAQVVERRFDDFGRPSGEGSWTLA